MKHLIKVGMIAALLVVSRWLPLLVVGVLNFLGVFGDPEQGTLDPRQHKLSTAMREVISEDPRNQNVKITPRYLSWSRDVLILNTKSCKNSRPVDVFRVLWSLSNKVADIDFEEVRLLNHGKHVYTLSGGDFSRLGQQRRGGFLPLYVLRTFPAKLRTPDGDPAFPTWAGGIIQVMGVQMEQFNHFIRKWCLPEMVLP